MIAHELAAIRYLIDIGTPKLLINEYLALTTALRHEYSNPTGGFGSKDAIELRLEVDRIRNQIIDFVKTSEEPELAEDAKRAIVTVTKMVTRVDPYGTGNFARKLEGIIDELSQTKAP